MTTPSLCAQVQQNNPGSKKESGARASTAEPYDLTLPEEVIVTGHPSISSIRREIFNIQDLVYDTFNELNKDDEYDMVCEKEARIGSQIKYNRCRPRFMREAVSEAFVDWRDGDLAVVNGAEMRRKSWRQREIMADLANKNPEFLKLLKKRLELRKMIESELE